MADRSETLTINIVSIPESYQSEGFTCENQDCISETLTITSVNITELIHTIKFTRFPRSEGFTQGDMEPFISGAWNTEPPPFSRTPTSKIHVFCNQH